MPNPSCPPFSSAPSSNNPPLFSGSASGSTTTTTTTSSDTPSQFAGASVSILGSTLVSPSTASEDSYIPSLSPSISSNSSDASNWACDSPSPHFKRHPAIEPRTTFAALPPQTPHSMLSIGPDPITSKAPPDAVQQPAAERSWASAHRASSRELVIPSPVPSPPASNPLPSSSAHQLEPNSSSPLLSVHAPSEERRGSAYLSMEGASRPAHDSTWPFQGNPAHLEASLARTDDAGMLKSPSQINPIFGLPPRPDAPAAEPYRDPEDYAYAAVGQYESGKASPPTQHSNGLDHQDRLPGGRHAHSASKAGAARPFYRSTPLSHSTGSTQVNMGNSGASAGRWPLPRSGPSHASLGLYNTPPRSGLRASLDSSSAWLVYYFAFNLGLTIYNKRVLQGFPFPWTLTGVHTLCGAIGSQVALSYRFFTPSRLTRRENLTLVAFSVLYTVNIAVSNLSLHLVTVPFHQVVRATTPLFTIALSILYFGKSYSSATYLSLLVVVAGVGFSTFGDYGWTTWGLFLTLLGTLLAALKTVVTNAIQVGRLKLHPLDLLMRMSPLAFVQCVVYSYWSGEMARVREYGATRMTSGKAWALAVNGIIAFGLNVVSFTANKKTSALTMTVAANVKQVLTIVLAVFIFDLIITPTNLFGITLTLVGGAYYAKIEFDKKTKAAGAKAAMSVGEANGGPYNKAGASPLLDIVAGTEKLVKE